MTGNLTPIDVSGLRVVINPCDLRRDLHVFIEYIRERDVKRSHRGNNLSKADAHRLAKLMSDPEAATDVKESGFSSWVNYVDKVALQLGFVHYDTEGRYMGYTSVEPSFPDNYIEFKEITYQKFLTSSLQRQEHQLLDSLTDTFGYSKNEFFSTTPLSRLDAFDTWGCATGVLPHINFARARRLLLELLKDCQSGIWYSTASLIDTLKTQQPFFLIPENPKRTRSLKEGRYGNFYEHRGSRWGNRTTVSDTDPDAFERVEGRYVERFLERIPLSLGYVDVAYGDKQDADLFPSRGELKAFRIQPRFLKFMQGEIPPPRVTVQPNFEIQVESECYPAQVLATLRPLTNVVIQDKAIILKLEKKKVAAQLAQDEGLDVVELLQSLSDRELPQNVLIELEEWSGHSEAFTLYEGFSLLEGNIEPAAVENFTVERISPTLCIVKTPDTLFARLEEAELVPLLIKHGKRALQPLPKTARTVFPKVSTKAKVKARRKKVVVKRQVIVTLHFPGEELFDIFRKDLLEVRCPIQLDEARRTISFPQTYESHLKAIVKRLNKTYQIQLKELE